jgi:hypothetical protein
MGDHTNDTEDDAVLTKPKKPRSEAQKAATEKLVNATKAKHIASGNLTIGEKKIRLQLLKEQLNGPTLKQKREQEAEVANEEQSDEEEEVKKAEPIKKKAEKSKPKKEPTIIYESPSESEEEVIIVKKKKKKTKKTIIYESESEDEEEVVAPKSRETKTQQNSSSKFKVTLPDVKPKGPIYYFA